MGKTAKKHSRLLRRKTVKRGGNLFSWGKQNNKPTNSTQPQQQTEIKVGNVIIHSSKSNITNKYGFNIEGWDDMIIIFAPSINHMNYVTNINSKNPTNPNIAKYLSSINLKHIQITNKNKNVTISILGNDLLLKFCQTNCNAAGYDAPLKTYTDITIPLTNIREIAFDTDKIYTNISSYYGGRKNTRKNRHNKTRRV